MSAFLRSRGRTHCLLAMGLLACLMLVMAPLGAWPLVVSSQPAIAFSQHAAHGSMHGDDNTDCCAAGGAFADPLAAHACGCALLCAGVLSVASIVVAASLGGSTRHAPPRPFDAPPTGFTPPLRPPLG